MTIQAAFAEELPSFQYADDGLLSLVRNNGHFDLAGLDIEDAIRRISLGENDPALCEIQDRSARPHESEECLGVERLLLLSRHFGEKRFEVEGRLPFTFSIYRAQVRG